MGRYGSTMLELLTLYCQASVIYSCFLHLAI